MNNLKVGVIIGRFQPVTIEQIKNLFHPSISENDLTVVILGSSDKSRDFRDPFTWLERASLIRQSLVDMYGRNILTKRGSETVVMFEPVRDYWYNKTRWLTSIQDATSESIKVFSQDDVRLSKCSITLYGLNRNDADAEYLNSFPGWTSRVSERKVRADQSRNVLKTLYADGYAKESVTDSVRIFLETWKDTEAGQNMRASFEHIQKYRLKYDALEKQAGHKLQFMTTDNVVIHLGHILLVRRRSHPGKGLWALPGGFLEFDETTLTGAKRELREETGFKVRDEWLVKEGRFDHPTRSARGRVLTHAFRWEVPSHWNIPQLNPEKGFEQEVTRVKWFPLSEVITDMADQLFEDHLDIIESLAY